VPDLVSIVDQPVLERLGPGRIVSVRILDIVQVFQPHVWGPFMPVNCHWGVLLGNGTLRASSMALMLPQSFLLIKQWALSEELVELFFSDEGGLLDSDLLGPFSKFGLL
jgi:hypothetical protein